MAIRAQSLNVLRFVVTTITVNVYHTSQKEAEMHVLPEVEMISATLSKFQPELTALTWYDDEWEEADEGDTQDRWLWKMRDVVYEGKTWDMFDLNIDRSLLASMTVRAHMWRVISEVNTSDRSFGGRYESETRTLMFYFEGLKQAVDGGLIRTVGEPKSRAAYFREYRAARKAAGNPVKSHKPKKSRAEYFREYRAKKEAE
jgi:hypothetical protein